MRFKLRPTAYGLFWRLALFVGFVIAMFIYKFAFDSLKVLIAVIKDLLAEPASDGFWDKVVHWFEMAIKSIKHIFSINEYIQDLYNVIYLYIFTVSYAFVYAIRKLVVCSAIEKDVSKGLAFFALAVLTAPIACVVYLVTCLIDIIRMIAMDPRWCVIWRSFYLSFTLIFCFFGIFLAIYYKAWYAIFLLLVPSVLLTVRLILKYRERGEIAMAVIMGSLSVIFFPISLIITIKDLIKEIIEETKACEYE